MALSIPEAGIAATLTDEFASTASKHGALANAREVKGDTDSVMNGFGLAPKAANNHLLRLWYNFFRCLLFLRDRG